MGGTKEQTSTSLNTPWNVGQLQRVQDLALTQGFSNPQARFAGYQGPTLAGINPTTQYSLDVTRSIADANQPLADRGMGSTVNMIDAGGLTQEQRANAGVLQGIAAGNEVDNPYLQKMLDASNARIATQQASMASGMGRYGSGAHTAVATKAMAEAANPVLASAYENAKGRQLQASGLLDNIYSGGQGRTLQAASMLPAMTNLRYDGASRLAGIGDFYQGRDQAGLDARIQQRENQLRAPLNQVEWINAILTGQGQLGGFKSSTTPGKQTSAAQGILGGAASGAALGSAIPVVGTGLGALGGGILGALGSF